MLVRQIPEVRIGRRPADRELRGAAARKSEELGHPPARQPEAPLADFRTTGRERAMRARSAVPASISALTGGRVTFTGSAVAPGVRSTWPSVRTTTSAAASRSRRLPSCSGTTRIRSPRRTSAALFGRRSTSAAIWSSAYSSAAFDTASRGSTSAPNTRARMRRKPRNGPKPSPARPAAATAAPQSGWMPSWFAANACDVVAGDELDRVVGPLLEERLELRDGLAPRQPADVDAGDLGSGRELAPRAGEGEADEDSETLRRRRPRRRRSRSRASASTSAAARCVERRLCAHRTANSRGDPASSGSGAQVKNWRAFVTEIGDTRALRRLESAVGGGMGCPEKEALRRRRARSRPRRRAPRR